MPKYPEFYSCQFPAAVLYCPLRLSAWSSDRVPDLWTVKSRKLPRATGKHTWGISTVGRTSLPYCRPSGTLVNQGNPFKMKGNVTRPADVKRGKLPRKTSGNPYGALAQLVARDIRIVEVRGSTPLCSTRGEALKSLDFRAFPFSREREKIGH